MASSQNSPTDPEKSPRERIQLREERETRSTNPRKTRMRNRKERVTFRIPEEMLEQVEELVDEDEYPNRSEAIRSALTDLLDERKEREGTNSW